MNLRKNFIFQGISLINFINLNNEEILIVRNWRNNESIKKWMYSDHIISLSEHNKFLKELKKDNKNFYWLVKDKNDVYKGVVYFNRADFKNKNAYMGIYSNPDMKGVGQFLLEALKEVAFENFGFNFLKLEVIESNQKAINFYKKNNFKEEGKLKKFVNKDDKWQDVIIMGILNKNEV